MIYIFCAPSGSGKSTMVKHLLTKYPDHFEVSVRDNGKGFNPDSIVSDGHSHIGISNVRDRLQKICGGTLKIESQQGKGTTATIIIPKKSQL